MLKNFTAYLIMLCMMTSSGYFMLDLLAETGQGSQLDKVPPVNKEKKKKTKRSFFWVREEE